MFIYNLKLSSKGIFKTIFAIMITLGIILCIFVTWKIILKSGTQKSTEIYQIETKNYTNVLKAVHDDIDTYIGQKIGFSGYVYRVYDLAENQFVLARDMVVSSDFKTLVVGFLCSSDNAKNFKDGTWVNITGEITKGYYHGDIPIIKIETIEKTEMPRDNMVYPPDEFYIPTSSLLYNNL